MDIQLIIPIIVAGALPYVWTSVAKVGAFALEDNNRTRDWQAELDGWRKRAHWAQQNSFEGFPLFAVAAVVAGIQAEGSLIALGAAWGYVATRLLYGVCYIKDWARPRSMTFFVGMICVVTLFVEALRA